MLILLLLAGAMLGAAPAAWAGTADDPEVEDPSGDASVTGFGTGVDAAADVVAAWFAEAGDGSGAGTELEATVRVATSEDVATSAQLADLEWRAGFEVNGTLWELRAYYTGTPSRLEAEVRFDGSPLGPADAEASVVADTVSVRWIDAPTYLDLPVLLEATHARSLNSDDDPVDWAPDGAADGSAFGRAFAFGGQAAVLDLAPADDQPARQEAAAGGTAAFALDLSHRGGNAGVGDLDVALGTVGVPAGWDPRTTPERETVAPGDEVPVTLTLAVPDDAEPGTRVAFNATAEAPDGSTRTLPLAVEVVEGEAGGPGVSISLSRAEATAPAGGETTYALQVVNVGDDRDTLQASVSASGDRAGWAALSWRSLQVPARGVETLEVTVAPPRDAPPGDVVHTVTVASGRDPAVTASRDLTTAVVEAGVDDVVPGGAAWVLLVAVVLAIVVAGAVAWTLLSGRRGGGAEGDGESGRGGRGRRRRRRRRRR